MEIILIICLLLGISGLQIPLICIDDKISKVNDNLKKMNEYLEELPVYSTNYDDSAEHNQELDMLTYDRVIGDLISSNPIPEEKLNTEETEE